jgi:predicted RNA-binding Zn ribbon-like protein
MLPGPDGTPHVSGSRLCLGIVNSVLWRRSEAPVEKLATYADLVRSVERAGWLETADELISVSLAHPRKASRSLGRAVDLRERLFSLFSDVAAGTQPAVGDLRSLNACLAESMAEIEVALRGDGGFRVRWRRTTSLDVPLWQIAASAADLLATDDVRSLKQCPGERCGWVFLDESSNRSRRWCDSRMCGNRARVRAHYQRSRAG